METETWIIVAAVVGGILLLTGAIWFLAVRPRRRAHRDELRERFGTEYDATVGDLGRRRGERELHDRMQRFAELELDRVPPDRREAITRRWKEVQYRFIEDPGYSVREAEHLISLLMHERGYPTGGIDVRARAMSIDYPELAQPYREAHQTYRSVEDGRAEVGAMFDAVVRYRTVCEGLLERPKREEGLEGSKPPDGAALAGNAHPVEHRGN
jgi:hypothetical protein